MDPPIETQRKMGIDTSAWNVGRDGAVKVAYPSKILDLSYVMHEVGSKSVSLISNDQ